MLTLEEPLARGLSGSGDSWMVAGAVGTEGEESRSVAFWLFLMLAWAGAGRRSRGMLIGREASRERWERSWTRDAVEVEETGLRLGRPNTRVDLWTSGAAEDWTPLSLSRVEMCPGWTSLTSSRMWEEGITDECLL